jgi:hypothetical protein
MTAQIYDLTACPHFKFTSDAKRRQPLASTAQTALERATEDYFFASVGLRQPVMPVEDHTYLTECLQDLRDKAPSQRVRQRCGQRLAAIEAQQKQQGGVA